MDALITLEKLMEMTEASQKKSKLEHNLQPLELSELVTYLSMDIIRT